MKPDYSTSLLHAWGRINSRGSVSNPDQRAARYVASDRSERFDSSKPAPME